MHQLLRVLIVEDSADDVELLLLALRREGHAEITFAVAATAYELSLALQDRDWDVVTCDYNLPGFSATEALALTRQSCPDVPFIIVSGVMDLEAVVALMRQGAQDYVPKQHLPRLAMAIDRCLGETARRRAHDRNLQALRASETRYRRLFETAQDGILIMDPETERITDVNPYLASMLGYPKEGLIGQKLWEIGLLKDIEASKQTFKKLQEGGYVRYDNLPLETVGGKRLDVEFVSNVYVVGEHKVIQCNIRDITGRRQSELKIKALTDRLEQRVKDRTLQLEALNTELEAFSYSVSHDLRAPLRQVDGFAHILAKDYLDQNDTPAFEVVQRILSSVKRMGTLIDALLSLANHSLAGINCVPIDCSAMVRAVAQELSQGDPTRSVEWIIPERAIVQADAQLLRIALDNLVGNAWKFTAKQPRARIEFGVAPQSDGSVLCFVRDNGAGFDMAHASRMFGAFRRLHSSLEFPGSGIGLATVQRIVHRHGGRIWAEGAVDCGATFWFTLGNGAPAATRDVEDGPHGLPVARRTSNGNGDTLNSRPD